MSKEDKAKLDNYAGGITGDTLPIGSIVEWGTDAAPANWLLCDGQAVSRTDYEELFAVLGTTYGEGDGSTTFNLPNRQGLIGIGAGTHTDKNGTEKTFELGKEYGEYEHTLTENEMPSHGNHLIDGGTLGYGNATDKLLGASTLLDAGENMRKRMGC